MDNQAVIQELINIEHALEQRRDELKQHFKRIDIDAKQLLDFKVRVNAQLSSLDQAILKVLNRISDRTIVGVGKGVKPLKPAQVSTMRKALNDIQKPIVNTATARQIATAVSQIIVAAAKATDAAKREIV